MSAENNAGDYTRDDLERDLAVSRATTECIENYRALLDEWSSRFNLIGPKELALFWRRHALDSAQLLHLAPRAKRWIDIGSGAGLPGLIVACMLKGAPGAAVHVVESTAKKASFLRQASIALALPVEVFNSRIEDFTKTRTDRLWYDVVTARAVAPLPRLIEHAKPILDRGAQGLFHKGADLDAELAAAQRALDGGGYKADVLESKSDPSGRIVRIIKAV